MAASFAKIDTCSIPKFDGTNFQLWKFGITILLKAEKLMKIVDGTTKEPDDKTSADWEAWDTKNTKSQVILLSTICQEQMQHLINCDDATKMWNRLISIHEQKTEISRELLWQKFYEYKMPDNGNIAKHISAIELLVRQLKDVKETISPSAICSKVINSLPSRFNAFRTAWDSVDSNQQTFENLSARLLKEESRMSHDDSEMSRLALEVKALQSKLESVTVNNKKKNINDLKKNSVCNYCKKKGHWIRECRKRLANIKKNDRSSTSNLPSSSSSSAFICDISSLYTASSDIEKSQWICDSGASVHMSSERNLFTNLQEVNKPMFVRIANDKLITVAGKGTIEIQVFANYQWQNKTMTDVLYIPELSRNLFSVGAMTDKNFTYHSYKNHCEFRDSQKQVVCVGYRKNNLWIMKFRMKPQQECHVSTINNSLKLWHDRLGHVNCHYIKKTSELVSDLKITEKEPFFCESCQFGKQSKVSHKNLSVKRAEKPGFMIHSDVCGPMNIPSPSGTKYFVLFKDDCSGYRTVYFLKHKSEVLSKFVEYKTLVENQTGNKIRVFKSDRGGEYISKSFKDFLQKAGISPEYSAAYTPQQNGRSEREIRTITECARTMLINKNVFQELWSEAVNCAVYILNRTANTQIDNMTAYEKWFGRKPQVRHVRIFGSIAYMAIPDQFRKKFETKSRKLLLVGYDGHSSNYRLWDPEKRRIEISCNVSFNENDIFSPKKETFTLYFDLSENYEPQNETPEVPENIDEDNPSEENTEIEESFNEYLSDEDYQCEENFELKNENRRELRDRSKLSKPNFYNAYANYCSLSEPTTYEEAISCEDSDKWRLAMQEEINALKCNNTWDLVTLPKNAKIVDNKWVFRIKTSSDGKPLRYKARLVARGFTQEKGVDYQETFAPVVRYDSIRILLALATEHDMHISNFDVQTAFLYGDLSECVYMKQPTGFENQKKTGLVCKLNRSLYGLKQSARCWNRKFVSFLNKYDFKQLKTDPCVFLGHFADNEIYLAIYVDDGLLMSNSKTAISELINILKQMFKIVVNLDSSKLNFVGLEIEQNISDGIVCIHQQMYINRLVNKFKMSDAKPLSVPAEPGILLSLPENTMCAKKQPYREAVGSLMFLATCSRPDISFAVNQVSRFYNNWQDEHWQAVKRIFRYLKLTAHYKIVFSKSLKINLFGYTDADYAGCIDTRKSTSGYVFVLANAPITWKCQKQTVVAQSTTEAEYLALSLGVREALWLKSFLNELGINFPQVKINVDNQSAIKLAQAQQQHSRTKHIDIKVHFVRDEIEKGNISVNYVNSNEQLADILTKPVTKIVLNNCLNKLNMLL